MISSSEATIAEKTIIVIGNSGTTNAPIISIEVISSDTVNQRIVEVDVDDTF